jgi:hypothetical protein
MRDASADTKQRFRIDSWWHSGVGRLCSSVDSQLGPLQLKPEPTAKSTIAPIP